MAFPRVLFAGDSNLKFATKFIPTGYAECLKVMSVPGASIVDDTKDFEKLLLKMLKSFMPEELFLHLGSNDADRRTSPWRVNRGLRQLIKAILEVLPSVDVKICTVLPRSHNAYKTESWNRTVLPKIEESVIEVNHALRDVCTKDELNFINYPLISKQNIGMDGLHVKPAGAKDLLFTVIGNVKRKFFAPAVIAPCTAAESVHWPALPSTESSLTATASGYDALKKDVDGEKKIENYTMNESNRRCSDSDPTGPEEIPDILDNKANSVPNPPSPVSVADKSYDYKVERKSKTELESPPESPLTHSIPKATTRKKGTDFMPGNRLLLELER